MQVIFFHFECELTEHLLLLFSAAAGFVQWLCNKKASLNHLVDLDNALDPISLCTD